MNQEPSLSAAVLQNGLLLIVPAMAISFGLWSLMPAAYGDVSFDRGIPTWLIVTESVLRIAVFGMPLFLYFGNRSSLQTSGWYLYTIGMVLYLASYLAQIYLPGSWWSRSILGFTAPAWTTLVWLLGIGLVCADTWLPWPWLRWAYVSAASAFVLVHTTHAYLAFVEHAPA